MTEIKEVIYTLKKNRLRKSGDYFSPTTYDVLNFFLNAGDRRTKHFIQKNVVHFSLEVTKKTIIVIQIEHSKCYASQHW
jgi:hypothetical protein